MQKDETDERIERYIAEAFVRKGEQEVLDELAGVESADKLRQIMEAAERRLRPIPMNTVVRGHRSIAAKRGVQLAWMMSVAAIIAVVLFIGFQPRYSAGELYMRWKDEVLFESVIARGGDEVTEEQGKSIESAILLARSGKSEEAIEMLMPIASDGLSEYQEDAQWQLVIIYLHRGERDRAEMMLSKIVDRAGLLAKEAKELLNEINERRWF